MYPPVPSWSFQSKLSDCRIVPTDPIPRPARNDGHTIHDLDRLLKDRLRPIDIFQPVTARRRRKQMRADFRKEMRRDFAVVGGRETRGALPTGNPADAVEIQHHIV